MTSAEIRQSFLDFFRSKKHTIVPSSSLLPDAPNLLFTNAGMNQFVPIFLGQRKPDLSNWPDAVNWYGEKNRDGTLNKTSDTRAADTQKCIRAGGKHNDLEDVGLDTYHHTFFEMLGNWSFGDYFKKEAIEWAWELITDVWKFPKNRLYATVYSPDRSAGDPSDFDQEAHDIWAEKFRAAGLDPKIHIVNGNKKDNFWMMGDTGPCGPCSEIHVDLTPNGDTKGSLVNKGDARCIEIWNLVFIQFNAEPDGPEEAAKMTKPNAKAGIDWRQRFVPLPAKHVDTGMGFERVTGIIQNTKGFSDFSRTISNYETDIFRPIFNKIEELSGKKYKATLPPVGSTGTNEQEKIDVAFRVIADHIRTLSFGIADGIEPGNKERNSVLRRILRRAVRYGRTLEFHEPFFYKLANVLAETMGHVFPEIRLKLEHVEEVIKREEVAFNRTLDRGLALFEEEISSLQKLVSSSGRQAEASHELEAAIVLKSEAKLSDDERLQQRRKQRKELALNRCVTGEAAFVLSDTYGFPIDLTQLIARERGFSVDRPGFDQFVARQKEIGKEDHRGNKEVIELSKIQTIAPTQFVGYEYLETPAKILELVREKDNTAVILDKSPLYAEMGGQVGDSGELIGNGNLWRISNTQKSGNAWLHLLAEDGTPDTQQSDTPSIGSTVTLSVDRPRRFSIQRHHTVTHLLHWALHEVVSKDAVQKGSYVGPEKLTFDFSSAPLTPQQIADVEKLVNERILENVGVSWTEVPYSEVKLRKDVMQLFGEKYADRVRVVQIGGKPTALDGYSMELCGGTHTRATGEVGLFRIVAESATGAGIRRIEAVAGLEAYKLANEQLQLIKSLAGKINTPVTELEKKIESLLTQQKDLEKQLKASQQKQAAETARTLTAKAQTIGSTRAIIEKVSPADGDYLQSIADSLKGQFNGVVVLGGSTNGAVALVATVSPDLTKQIQAGKIIQTIAPIVGGKGGGRPDNARGGGKEVSKLDEALAKAKSLLG
jgi:alanyl-tRNA synthetase